MVLFSSLAFIINFLGKYECFRAFLYGVYQSFFGLIIVDGARFQKVMFSSSLLVMHFRCWLIQVYWCIMDGGGRVLQEVGLAGWC